MRNRKLISIGIFCLMLLGFVGCTTYYIPVESFKEQFKGINSTNLKSVKTRGPVGEITEYMANPIDYIKCFDKENNPIKLRNSPSIEIRFTEKNNKKTIYYFDRIYMQDSLIIGDMSRIFSIKKNISINNVKKIEVQDGHKNFKYVVNW